MEDVLHLSVPIVCRLVYVQHLSVAAVLVGLVEDAQHLYEAVVYPAMQERYLHDYAVVHQALHEWVRHPLCHLHAIVVVGLVPDVQHRLLDVSHPMPEQVYGYHRDAVAVGIGVLQDVVGVGVLRAEVLAEAERLRLEPCLLELYKDELQAAVVLAYLRPEVDAEHGYLIARAVGILVLAHLYLRHLSLQQGGEKRLGYAVVLHEVLEDRIVNRVCYAYYHGCFLLLVAKVLLLFYISKLFGDFEGRTIVLSSIHYRVLLHASPCGHGRGP